MLPKAKRLRGAQLQLAMDASETSGEPLPKGEQPSALAHLLLSLWSHGHLSASLIQQVAHMALLDGASHPELVSMGGCGNWGELAGNAHRDVMATFCADIQITPPVSIQVEVMDPKTSLHSVEDASLFLPHMLFSDLAHHHPEQFQTMFGLDKLKDFWLEVEKSEDDRLLGHPICLDKRQGLVKRSVQQKESTIPLFLHADGVEFQTRDSLLCWNWGCLLNQLHSLSSHFLLCAFPKSCSVDGTWGPLMAWIKWSLEAMQDGLHPVVDPFNNPLPKGSVWDKLQGQALTPGQQRAVVWTLQGDHEMFANILKLPHWRSQFCCWSCDAQQPKTKKKACPAGKSYKILKEEDQNFVYLDNAAALAKGKSDHVLFSIPGLTTRMVRHDGLHVFLVSGIANHLLGGLLHYIMYFDGKGPQTVKPTDRLAMVFEQVQQVYRESSTPTRLSNLKASMVTDPKKPHQDFPCLQAKGSETKHFGPAFLPVLQSLLDTSKEEHSKMVEALECLVNLLSVFDAADMVLTEMEFHQATDLAKRFFYAYDWLHGWAAGVDRKLFHITMKFHTGHHLVHDSRHLNPKACWNFRSEDFVGRISRLGSSVAMGVKSTRLSTKIGAKYRALLHMQLKRLGFGVISYQDDP